MVAYLGDFLDNLLTIGTYLQTFILMVALAAPGVTEIRQTAKPEKEPVVAEEPVAAKNPLPEELEKIAQCESGNRHFGKNGKVLRGALNAYDVGKYQINVLYWGDEAKKSGYDLFSEEGNEAMALKLYQKYSNAPWKESKYCWAGKNKALLVKKNDR